MANSEKRKILSENGSGGNFLLFSFCLLLLNPVVFSPTVGG